MTNLKSNDVYVFPAANRTGSLTASLTTEYNLVKLVTRLTSQESFVISDYVDTGVGSYFEFCIKGYYFRVPTKALVSLLSADNPTLYATLTISSDEATVVNRLGPQITAGEGETLDTKAVDVDGFPSTANFTGLSLDTTPGSGYDLALITRTGENTYTIPPESLVRMCTDASHRYVTIDDGDLDAT